MIKSGFRMHFILKHFFLIFWPLQGIPIGRVQTLRGIATHCARGNKAYFTSISFVTIVSNNLVANDIESC